MPIADQCWLDAIRRAVLLLLPVGLLACGRADGLRIVDAETSALRVPGTVEAAVPRLSAAADGVLLSWLAEEGTPPTAPRADASRALAGDPPGLALYASHLGAGGFVDPRRIAGGSNWLRHRADLPSVVQLASGRLAAHWIERAGHGATAVRVMYQSDTAAWGEVVTPHTDGGAGERGFATLFDWHGAVGVAWVDARAQPAMLRVARLADGSAPDDGLAVDTSVCDCCQTSVVVLADGPVVAYRARRSLPLPSAAQAALAGPDAGIGEARDVMVARFAGGTWQRPVELAADHWRINGCPVNGPAMAGNAVPGATGATLVVAWYSQADGHASVRIARSADGGNTFSAPEVVDSGPLPTAGAEGGQPRPLGHVDVVVLPDGHSVVGWLRARVDDQAADVLVRLLPPMGPPARSAYRIAVVGRERPPGFPQLERSGDDLVIAYADVDAAGESRLHAARLDVASLR